MISRYTDKEIDEALEERLSEARPYWDLDDVSDDPSLLTILKVGDELFDVKCEYFFDDQEGRPAYQMGHPYIILKIGDQFFKKHGCYHSLEGYDWDGVLHRVTKQEKIVTTWEPYEQ